MCIKYICTVFIYYVIVIHGQTCPTTEKHMLLSWIAGMFSASLNWIKTDRFTFIILYFELPLKPLWQLETSLGNECWFVYLNCDELVITLCSSHGKVNVPLFLNHHFSQFVKHCRLWSPQIWTAPRGCNSAVQQLESYYRQRSIWMGKQN